MNSQKRTMSTLTSTFNGVMEPILRMAKKYLFFPADQKALIYLVVVFLVSTFSTYYPPSEGYHFLASKSNVFNRFGTKIGWFWTLVTVGPFIWLTSYLHHKNHMEALRHLSRLLIATGCWYFVTHTYIHVEKLTRRCVHHPDGVLSDQEDCSLAGGNWAPGIDISGHAFMLVYIALIITEEAVSFTNWPKTPKRGLKIASVEEFSEFKSMTKAVQGLFLILFFFHLLWDSQLLVTCLYYHDVNHKILGAGTAIACWYLTYRLWYPNMAFPGKPIQRKFKAF